MRCAGSESERSPFKAEKMKRFGNLFEKIISLENLRLADEKARKGKKKSIGVRRHDRNREENLLKLHEALKNKTFTTSRYHIFKIYEPKEREIYQLPYYPDRIVHHAIMNVVHDIWVKSLPYNSYSCIKGRGIDGCRKQVLKNFKHYKNKLLYVLKIDIRKYYPSINHEILKKVIRRTIKCKDTLELLDDIIDSAPGVPIGNYLSQFFANLYLSEFMHIINEKYKVLATLYADDIVFYSDDKNQLHNLFYQFIKPYLLQERLLEVKSNYQIFPVGECRGKGRPLDYLGYQFYKKQILLRKKTKRNFAKKVKGLKKPMPTKEFKQLICSWLGWIYRSNSVHLFKTIIPSEYEDILCRQAGRV